MSLHTCPQCAAPLPDGAPAGTLCPACTSEASARTVIQPAPTAAAATVIGDFQIIDKLGQGGMGAVYRARQLSLDRLVALKVLPEQFSGDPEFLARFQREARVAASLQHPNLVRVFSAGHADACHYIAMELIDGENLQQRLKRERLAIPEALRICADVARGLEFGWDRAQLIHRDIKPANIYLSHAGEVKVGDLGIAKSLTGETTGLTQTGTMMGTPYYMSPEQIRGDKALDFRADVYSLGCTLYEMLTGKPPYPGSDPITIARAHLDAPLPAILKALPGCPIPLARLVGRMLKKSPRERHASYADLIAEMDSVMQVLVHGDASAGRVAAAWKQLSEEPVLTMPKPATARPPTTAAPAARSKLPLQATIAAGVLVLGAIIYLVTRPAKPAGPPRRGLVTAATPTPGGQRGAPALPTPTPAAATDGPWVDGLAEWWAKHGSDGLGADTSFKREAGGSRIGTLTSVGVWEQRGGEIADVAVRVTISAAENWNIYLRATDPRRFRRYYANIGAGMGVLGYQAPDLKATRLVEFPLPAGFNIADRHTGEFRAQGDTLTFLLDGQEMAKVQDQRLKTGTALVSASDGALIEKLEYRELPALTPAVAATDEPWVDALAKWWAARPTQAALVVKEAEGIRVVNRSASSAFYITVGSFENAAIRATAQADSPSAWSLLLRTRQGPETKGRESYEVRLNKDGKTGYVELERAGASTNLTTFQLPPGYSPTDRHTMECSIRGDELVCVFDGREVARVRDGTLKGKGDFLFTTPPGTLLEKLEYRELPALAPAISAEPWVDGLAEWWQVHGKEASIEKQLAKEAGGSRVGTIASLEAWEKRGGDIADVALRATVSGATSWRLYLRSDRDAGRYYWHLTDSSGALYWFPGNDQPAEKLTAFRMPAGFVITERHTGEFRAQGDTLAFLLNGQEMASAKDSRIKSGGGFLNAPPGTLIEKLEYREMPAPAPAVPASGDDARTFGGHRYEFVPGALEWPAAKARAEALGGHLATLTTQEESDWVIAQFRDRFADPHTGVWLGASTDAKTGGWKWVTGEPFSFTAWGTEEPNGGLQGEPPYYLNLFRAPNYPSGIAWNDTPLTYRFWRQQNLGFLVEWDAPPTTAPGEQPQPAPVKLFTNAEKLGAPDPRRGLDNGVIRLDGTGAVASSFRARDMIVRGSIRANPDANSPSMLFRTRMEARVPSHYVFQLDAARREVLLRVLVAGNDRVLKKWPLPRAYGPDEWVRLELKAVGDQFTASADGQVLGTVRDTTLAQPGGINLHAAAKGYFRDIEYVPLDAAAAPQSPAPAVNGGAWVDALAAWWASPEMKRGLLVKEADGSRVADKSHGITIAKGRDLAIRATARAPRGSNWRLSLRYGAGGQGPTATDNFSAQLVDPGRPSVITSTVAGTLRTLKEFPLPPGFAIEQPHTMEFSAQGDVLTLRLDGQEVARVQDGSVTQAGLGYFVGEVGTLIEKLEYRELPPARP